VIKDSARIMDHNNILSSIESPFSLSITIESFSTETDDDGKYSLFHISVKTNILSWDVKRRYRQFRVLHEALQEELPAVKSRLPTIPAKRLLGSLLGSFVEDRKLSLELYLQELVIISEVVQHKKFLSFIDDSNLLAMQLQMAAFCNRIIYLEGSRGDLKSQLTSAQSKLDEAQMVIDQLQAQLETSKPPKDDLLQTAWTQNNFGNVSGNKGNKLIGLKPQSINTKSRPRPQTEQHTNLIDVPEFFAQSPGLFILNPNLYEFIRITITKIAILPNFHRLFCPKNSSNQ
jgi:PX domain